MKWFDAGARAASVRFACGDVMGKDVEGWVGHRKWITALVIEL